MITSNFVENTVHKSHVWNMSTTGIQYLGDGSGSRTIADGMESKTMTCGGHAPSCSKLRLEHAVETHGDDEHARQVRNRQLKADRSWTKLHGDMCM